MMPTPLRIDDVTDEQFLEERMKALAAIRYTRKNKPDLIGWPPEFDEAVATFAASQRVCAFVDEHNEHVAIELKALAPFMKGGTKPLSDDTKRSYA